MIPMNIIPFLKSTMRLATAIFLSIFAFAVLAGVATYSWSRWEKSQAHQYEAIKLWTVDLRKNLQFNLHAKTKLVDQRFFVMVTTDAHPQYLNVRRSPAGAEDEEILLNFVDKDGFKVFSKSIGIKKFSTTVNDAGESIGLNFEADESMDVSTYAAMSRLEVQWTVDTDTNVPSAQPVIPAANTKILDHCAPNLAKAERLRRLGQHGTVRQTGSGSYAVDHRTLAFYESSLVDCS